MSDLYVIGDTNTSGYFLNPRFIKSLSTHVPSVNRFVITIPQEQITPLYQDIKRYLKLHNDDDSFYVHLGIRRQNSAICLVDYVQRNPQFTDYNIKNVDSLSKRTNQNQQVDDFILSSKPQLRLLAQQLERYA